MYVISSNSLVLQKKYPKCIYKSKKKDAIDYAEFYPIYSSLQ